MAAKIVTAKTIGTPDDPAMFDFRKKILQKKFVELTGYDPICLFILSVSAWVSVQWCNVFWFVFKTNSAKSQQIFVLPRLPNLVTSKTKIQFDVKIRNDVKNSRISNFLLNLNNLCCRCRSEMSKPLAWSKHLLKTTKKQQWIMASSLQVDL